MPPRSTIAIVMLLGLGVSSMIVVAQQGDPRAPAPAPSPWRDLSYRAVYDLAQQAMRDERFDEAIELYGELQQRNDDPVIEYNRGLAEYRSGRLDAAVESMTNALERSPSASMLERGAFNLGRLAQERAKSVDGQITPEPGVERALTSASTQLDRLLDEYRWQLEQRPDDDGLRARGELAQALRESIERIREQMRQQQQQQQQDGEESDEQNQQQGGQQQQQPTEDEQQNQQQNDQRKPGQNGQPPSEQQQPQAGEDEQEQPGDDEQEPNEQQSPSGENERQQEQSPPQQSNGDEQQQNESPPQQSTGEEQPQNEQSGQPQSSENQQSSTGGLPADTGEVDDEMPEEEVERILQRVRDRERERREMLRDRARQRLEPVRKDW